MYDYFVPDLLFVILVVILLLLLLDSWRRK